MSTDVQAVINRVTTLRATRIAELKELTEQLCLLRAHARAISAGDGAQYRREIAYALADIKKDKSRLSAEEKSWAALEDELESELIQSLASTNEKHVAYNDLGTLSVADKSYWKIDGDADTPEARTANEQAFIEFLAQEVRVNNMTLAEVINLRQKRVSAAALEETVAAYAEKGIIVPGAVKVSKPTISFRAAK
jgi:hypothetical protein